MVNAMQVNTSVALALSHSLPELEKPYPLVLSPAEAYEREFLGRGCLACGPSAAIIRRSVFEGIGGFSSRWGVLSDIDLWYRIAAVHPVSLLPPGLVWWRRHDEQEYSCNDASLQYLRNSLALAVFSLDSIDCPLDPIKKSRALKRAKQHFARRILRVAIVERNPVLAVKLAKEFNLKFWEIASGVCSYR